MANEVKINTTFFIPSKCTVFLMATDKPTAAVCNGALIGQHKNVINADSFIQ